MAATVVGILAGGAGIASAAGPRATPISAGVIHGCMSTKAVKGTHTLTLQDVGTRCPTGSTAISWAQRSPAPSGGSGAISYIGNDSGAAPNAVAIGRAGVTLSAACAPNDRSYLTLTADQATSEPALVSGSFWMGSPNATPSSSFGGSYIQTDAGTSSMSNLVDFTIPTSGTASATLYARGGSDTDEVVNGSLLVARGTATFTVELHLQAGPQSCAARFQGVPGS